MQGFIKLVAAAALVAGVAAQPHEHGHRHRHAKNHEQRVGNVEKRQTVMYTDVVTGPTVLVYVLDGVTIDASTAEEGIAEGLYVVVGTSTPTYSAPVVSTTSSTSTSSTPAAEFFELKTSTTSTSTSTSTPTPTPTSTTTSTSVVPVATTPASSTSANIDTDFPNGQLKCSDGVPTAYGAIEVDWVGLSGWTSLQQVGTWRAGIAISYIVEPITGPCASGMFCSYACPPGYQKSQWPETSQGSSGQSIGGLWCNDDGYLELTRSTHPKICEQGAGGVTLQNNMSSSAAVCRTDYPAAETMDVPLASEPGNTYPLTNPQASTYYKWEGSSTTAQYYVNPKGVAVSDACLWTSPTNPLSAGNWAPTIIGVGQDDTGTTYLSIFPNLPTSSATLDFDIEITGDVSSSCYLKSGSYAGGSTGCTTAITSGGSAVIVFTDSS